MSDVIIIGGGVIGMLTARELHQAGADVLVIERGPLGGESSWAGGGIISPLQPWRYSDAVNHLAEISKAVYPSLAQQLQEESNIDCELTTSGLLFTDLDERMQAEDWAQEWAVELHTIKDDKLIHEIEPQLNRAIRGGLWMPKIMQIRNPKLVKALKGSFDTLGISYSEHTPVTELIIDGGAIKGVSTARETLTAERVIIASGAWSAGFIRQERNVEIEPVKGQMIMFSGEPGLIRRMVLSSGHYIIPRRDGRVLAGSTLERTGFDKAVTADANRELRLAAAAIIPALANMEIERQWAGLRPGTERGIPYICPHPEIDGLFINAGHYRNGVVLGPASARLMAEMITGQAVTLDPASYALEAAH
ncbi:MAG: glycine oxidase ThiO [Thiotrichales bacterium]|nr:MAG: glycine oxidase ThiO [Thiotrichales bacterium]